jgi:membrane carboxypeptidase/penicillin-binding protein PbpC
VQNKVQALARAHITKVRDEHNANNAAVVVMDTPSGEVRAMVGSLDYFDRTIDGQVNMAVSPRQPGSSFKIFTYSAAFAQGYTPATMVMDVRTSFPDPSRPAPYVPENSGRTFSGPALLRKALGSSLNIPAVAMAAKVGLPAVVETARAMGITTLNEPYYGLSLALGSAGATLLDMTYAYSVLANGGTMVGAPIDPAKFKPGYRQLDPVMILQVTDAKGKLLYKYDEPHQQEVLRSEVAFLVTDILSDNNARGPGLGYDSALKVKSRPAAAKTGTTNNYHDAWTLGYTPQYVVGVWVGNANYEEMTRAYAMEMAGPLWNQTIEMLHDGLPVLNFTRPPGIVTAVVDSVSGKLPTEQSPQRAQEIFIKGTVPTESDDVHKLFRICKQSGQLATAYCPADQVEEKVFEVYSTDAQDWMRENKVPIPPAESCHLHGPNLSTAEVAISSPRHLASVRATVPITGSARPGGFEKYTLQFGQGMTPKEWTPIGGEHNNAVDNNLLEMWDVRSLEGLYTLQLNVVAGGNTQQATVQVLVDNISPTIKLLAPVKDELIALDKDEWVNMQVLAADNISVAKVEFFMDGKALGISTVAPYTYRLLFRDWKEKEPLAGDHTVWVIAYDAAGNQQKSEEVHIRIGTEAQKRATATAVAQKR